MSEVDFELMRNMPVFGGLSNGTLKMLLDQSDIASVAAGEFFSEREIVHSPCSCCSKGLHLSNEFGKTPRLSWGDCEKETALAKCP